MKQNTISLRRRHLMIAGAAGVATPMSAVAGLCGRGSMGAHAEPIAIPAGEKLVVSGRIVDSRCKPVVNATVEAWHAHAHRTSVRTDGDGRFMFTTTTPAGRRPIDYRVGGKDCATGPRQLHLVTSAGSTDGAISQLHRDDAGVWRTTFALTLA
jgi:protocatechuate 3,4-dioxygenase beta subunit